MTLDISVIVSGLLSSTFTHASNREYQDSKRPY